MTFIMKIVAARWETVKNEDQAVNVSHTGQSSLHLESLKGILLYDLRAKLRSSMSTAKSRASLPLALGIAILAVSTASVLIRLAQKDAPSLTIAALRLTIATMILAPLAMTRYRVELRSLRPRDLMLAALSGVFLALHFGTWISSLEYTTIASSVVLVSTGPLWVALLSPLFLRERLTRGNLLGLALAILGGTVIGAGDACTFAGGIRCYELRAMAQGSSLCGNLLALAGAWAVSGYLIVGRRLRATLSLVPYVFLVYGFAAVCLIGVTLLSGEPVFGFAPSTYLWLLLLAIVPQLIGHSTYNWALRYLPAAFVAVTTLGEPIGSAILAYLILNEKPGPFVLAGGVLILFGIYLAASASQRAGAVAPKERDAADR